MRFSFMLAFTFLFPANLLYANVHETAMDDMLSRQYEFSRKLTDGGVYIRGLSPETENNLGLSKLVQLEGSGLQTFEKSHVTPTFSHNAINSSYFASLWMERRSATASQEAGNSKEETLEARPDAHQKETDSAQKPVNETEESFFPEHVISSALVGNADIYIAKKGDSLRLVAAKLGVSRRHLTQMNSLDPAEPLKEGQELRYNNLKIIPMHIPNGIIINIPDRTLYHFKEGKLASSVPVALGVPQKGSDFNWMTPTGKFRIVSKRKDPAWYVPRSIQSEMEKNGQEVITVMPPGKQNPLGRYAITTSLPGILIHSTTRPASIYSYASHGCIRVSPERMVHLFNEVKTGSPGEIIYQPVKLAITEEGRIFLEVHKDVYGRSGRLQNIAKQLIKKHNVEYNVDWNKVEQVVKDKTGLAEEISQIQ